MRSILITIIILFSVSAPPAHGDSPGSSDSDTSRDLDRIVARVDSEPITALEVQALRAANPDLDFSTALNALVDQRVVLSWAKQNNIAVSQDDILRTEQAIMQNNGIPEDQFDQVLAARGQNRDVFRNDLRDQILINKSLNTALESAMKIDETEIDKRYRELYPPERTFTIRHILLKPETASERDEVLVREQAKRIMDRIKEGASFEEMALEYSADSTTAGEGGYLGTFKKGELFPELEKLALELEPEEVGGPVRTSMGFHILKLVGKGLTQPPPLSQVRDRIRSDILSRKEPEVREKWLKELKEKAFIEIFADGE